MLQCSHLIWIVRHPLVSTLLVSVVVAQLRVIALEGFSVVCETLGIVVHIVVAGIVNTKEVPNIATDTRGIGGGAWGL